MTITISTLTTEHIDAVDAKNLVLQGPSRLPMTTFQKLFTHGYPEPS